ncbi:MAG: MFS transporter [Alphaproteobacteria bacterium]|nr:MFS transporter [Alphaproteobacteria bacterium]
MTVSLGQTAGRPPGSLLPAMVVATSCGFVGVVRGAAESFGVFILPLEEGLGLAHAEMTAIYALSLVTIGASGPFVGTLVDRFGPRTAYAIGTLMLVAAFVAASAATKLWQLQLALGVGVGMATACVGTSAQGPLVGRWFKNREATIFGIISGTAGLGALVFAPLSHFLIEEWGWRGAYQALAFIVSLLLLPLAFLPWRKLSAGRAEQSQGPSVDRGWDNPRAEADAVVAWQRLLAEPLLWRVLASHFLTCFAVFGVQVLVVVYLIDNGYAPLTAASAVGIAGLATALGVMFFGWLSERAGWRRTVTASFACTAIGMATLWAMGWSAAPWLLGLYVVTFGLSLGSRGPLMAGLVMRRFVGPAVGRVLGILLMAFGIGSASGAWLAGLLHDATGGYGAGFSVSGVALAVSLSIWWAWPDPSQPAKPQLPR